MAQVATAELDAGTLNRRAVLKRSVARVLDNTVFVSLLCLIVLTAIPHGSSQPWWRALFVCAILTLAILWLIEGLISETWFKDSWPLVLPLAALVLFSFLQTLPLGNKTGNPAGISFALWHTISADPYQTRFFALELTALTLAGMLLFRYADTERRVRITINVVIGVALASAIFGFLRQATTPSALYGLPFLPPDLGYGQFVNRNHFAFLMEMGLGLILGLLLGGGIKREHSLIYFAALLALWIGLVLCGSRGGLIAMLAQIIFAALLFDAVVRKRNSTEPRPRVLRVIQSLPARLILIFALVVGVVFGTVWLGGDRLAIRIDQSRDEITSETDPLNWGVSRNEIWKASWRMFVAHPILGVGMGAYWVAIPRFHDASGTMTPQEAHNDYLELLASGGLVGFVLAGWFVVVVVKRTRANLASPNRFRRAACFGATIGIAGVAVHSLVDFGLHTIVNALVFTTLAVIATSKPRLENASHSLFPNL